MNRLFCIHNTRQRELRYPLAFKMPQRGCKGDQHSLVKNCLGPLILVLFKYGLPVQPNGGRLSTQSNVTNCQNLSPIRYNTSSNIPTILHNILQGNILRLRGFPSLHHALLNISKSLSIFIAYINPQNINSGSLMFDWEDKPRRAKCISFREYVNALGLFVL